MSCNRGLAAAPAATAAATAAAPAAAAASPAHGGSDAGRGVAARSGVRPRGRGGGNRLIAHETVDKDKVPNVRRVIRLVPHAARVGVAR